LAGLAIPRRELDLALLRVAVDAGARVEVGARLVAPLVDESGGRIAVRGAIVEARGRRIRLPARVTIAADGRRSTMAISLGLTRHPLRPRRWAIGAYFGDVAGMGPCGEMHLRPSHYLGLAPIGHGLVNTCLVTAACPGLRDPASLLDRTLACDPWLADRFAGARRATPVMTLGPLAVDARAAGLPGLLLAGDAAGFIDPMTGDGLRFAIEGGWLAAQTALELLEQPQLRAWRRLERRRRRRFGLKRAFDRALRALTTSAATGRAADFAPVAPALLRGIIAEAGDVRLARRLSGTAPAPS
jgi:flavin-dependent dehydrogenase